MTSEQQNAVNALSIRYGAASHFENNSGIVIVRTFVPRKPYDPSYNPIKTFAIQIDGSTDCDGKIIDIDDL